VIRLYRAPWSTNVERVALALAHKGLPVESVVISYDDRSEVERVSGQGLVPVIVDEDGTVVSDSPVILEHVERLHPEPALYPVDAARRAEARVFIDWFNRVWKLAPNAIEAELEKPSPGSERIDARAAEMSGHLDLFEEMLDGRDHLFGDFSVVDCVAFPFLKYAVWRDEEDDEPFHRVLERYQRSTGVHPRLEAWVRRVDERPRA
jgi:glutathione S-transferase